MSRFFIERGAKHGVLTGYGMTETAAIFCISNHLTEQMLPFVRNNIKILDLDTGKELPCGQEGEVYLSGPSMMNGYYKNSTATADTLFDSDGIIWIRTGDLGVVTEDGFFEITGRLKRIFWGIGDNDTIFRIYPMKIEEVIASLDEIAQCAVVGRKDKEKGYLPIAYVTLFGTEAGSETVVKEKIFNVCSERFNMQSQPAEIYILEHLPVTRAGKIDFKKLEEMAN